MSSSFRGIFVGLPSKDDKILWQLDDPHFEKLSCNVFGIGVCIDIFRAEKGWSVCTKLVLWGVGGVCA